jgi:hypothetical protein
MSMKGRKPKPAYGVWACLDCGVDTVAVGEYYTLFDDVWLAANPDYYGMLCIGCLEKRLGRELTPDDFTDCPLNSEKTRETSAVRLKARLGR